MGADLVSQIPVTTQYRYQFPDNFIRSEARGGGVTACRDRRPPPALRATQQVSRTSPQSSLHTFGMLLIMVNRSSGVVQKYPLENRWLEKIAESTFKKNHSFCMKFGILQPIISHFQVFLDTLSYHPNNIKYFVCKLMNPQTWAAMLAAETKSNWL